MFVCTDRVCNSIRNARNEIYESDYGSLFRCGGRICSVKSIERELVGAFTLEAVYLFITISGFGQTVKYVEFPSYLRSAESSAQMYYPSLLCRRNTGWNGAQLRRHGPHIRCEIRQGD